MEAFADMLTGGHPNSLGRTIEVVEAVLKREERLAELFDCYQSDDEIVRMRVSSAMKRIAAERRQLLVPYIDRFIDEIGRLDQASAQWTLAELFEGFAPDMTRTQRRRALALMKDNLEHHNDWIVINRTMETLAGWAESDAVLAGWLEPQLRRHAGDKRKSIANRAAKTLKRLYGS